MIRRKKLACLGLAASMAMPSGLFKFTQLFADQSGNAGPASSGQGVQHRSSAALLSQGITQYNNGQFEESVATLQEVDARSLNDQDHQTLVNSLAKADAAATERRLARSEYARGEEARKGGRLAEAQGHYNAVISNFRADSETHEKAAQQLAALHAPKKGSGLDGKAAYDQAVDEYKKGLWVQSRADFKTAQKAGYTGGFLEASPADYLAKIDEGERKYVDNKSEDDRKAAARTAYDGGREAYRSGDFATARKDFSKARDLGFEPGFMEGLTPAEYLQRMDEKKAADQQHAQASGNDSRPVIYAADASSAPSSSGAGGGAGGSSSAVSQLQRQAQIDQLAEKQKGFKAQGLVDLGKTAEKNGNDQEALSDYTQAVDLDPSNHEAVQGRNRLLGKMGRGPSSGGASLTQAQVDLQRTIESINYEYKTAISKARAATSATPPDFSGAENAIANAQAARDQDPTAFNEADLRAFDAGIAQAQTALAQARASYDRNQRMQTAAQAAAAEQKLELAQRQQRQETVAALIKQSRAQIDQENYAAALGVLDQILVIDPNNDYAIGIRQFVEDKAVTQEQRKFREHFDASLARTLTKAQEAQIPYEDVYRFPENWPDISELRDNEAKNKNVSKEDQQVQAQLDHRLPNIKLPGIALTDAIDFLRELTGANILVNWKALEQDGIDKQTQVTAELHDVKFSKVLEIILAQAGGGKLAYGIEDGVITISTIEDLNQKVVTRTYDITDLLINPNFVPTVQSQGGGAQISGSGGGGGGGATFSSSSSSNNSSDRTTQLADIKKKIENTVEFSSWKDNDPQGFGQIDDFNNQLIITQTPAVHQKIVDLLATLRDTQAVQVSVEARFLTVTRHFLDDVGVNLGLNFNTKNPRNWSPISVTSNTSNFTEDPSTGIPGSIGTATTERDGLSTGVGFGFLDDFQVTAVIRAVQASSRLSVVHAPQVTLQNGQGATIYQTTFIPYVSSLNTTVATGAAIAAPVISNATDGVKLTIERAVVTADHKYVTLDIDPQLDAFLGFTTFTFQSATSQQTSSTSGGGTTIVSGGFSSPSLSVQEATEQKTEVRTRVTVPDGGTLLLGGVTIAGEVNLEAGVPGISKVPFLKRLVTNTSESNDEQVLLILVRPTIIINKEIEAKNFPLLTTNNH